MLYIPIFLSFTFIVLFSFIFHLDNCSIMICYCTALPVIVIVCIFIYCFYILSRTSNINKKKKENPINQFILSEFQLQNCNIRQIITVNDQMHILRLTKFIS